MQMVWEIEFLVLLSMFIFQVDDFSPNPHIFIKLKTKKKVTLPFFHKTCSDYYFHFIFLRCVFCSRGGSSSVLILNSEQLGKNKQ